MTIYNPKIKNFIVKNQRAAGRLMDRGFVLCGMQPDKEDDRRNIFLFKNSQALVDAFNEILMELKNEKK